MVAEFKSHVLSRDEKGFMGIPFKRLLLAGGGVVLSTPLPKSPPRTGQFHWR